MIDTPVSPRAFTIPPATPEARLLALVAELIQRVDTLTHHVEDLETWTAEIGDDLIDRTTASE